MGEGDFGDKVAEAKRLKALADHGGGEGHGVESEPVVDEHGNPVMGEDGKPVMKGQGPEGENDANATKENIKGVEVKILTPKYLDGLQGQKLDFASLKTKLEEDFRGFALPTGAVLNALKINEERKAADGGFNKIAGAFGSPDKFNILQCEEGGEIVRSPWYAQSGGSYDERDMNSTDQNFPHLKPTDCIVLVKKEDLGRLNLEKAPGSMAA